MSLDRRAYWKRRTHRWNEHEPLPITFRELNELEGLFPLVSWTWGRHGATFYFRITSTRAQLFDVED